MRFENTKLSGVYVIHPERIEDHRGFFARIWCNRELEDLGLPTSIAQTNAGFSKRKGTLRGLHFQTDPCPEVKVVRCSQGAMYDVVVDLRPDSSSYLQWIGEELTADNGRILYVPEGCAQGYITLCDNTEMYYHTSQFYAPDCASGVRFNDPIFKITWPADVEVISEQDQCWPDFVRKESDLAPEDKEC